MDILLELTESDVGLLQTKQPIAYKVRRASRVILIDRNKIAVLEVTKPHCWKIPGGGIEENESIEDAAIRETKEETGVVCKALRPLGVIIEYRNKWKMMQISYAFVAKVKTKGKPKFTAKEKKKGFTLHWVTMPKARQEFEKVQPTEYGTHFIAARDKVLLETYFKRRKQYD